MTTEWVEAEGEIKAQAGATSLWSPRMLVLVAVAFVVGTTEYLAVGVIPQIAHELRTSTSATALVSSLYATAVAVTTLPVAMTLMRHRPKLLLPTGVAVFAAAHAVMALAPTLLVLVAARVVAAAVHSLAIGSATSTAAALAPPRQRGAAVTMVVGGLSAAMFVGAPLGTALSEALGWRASFAVVGGLALVLAITLRWMLPNLPGQPVTGLTSLRVLAAGPVARPLLVIFGFLVAYSVPFTYLGAYLTEVTRIGGGGVAISLTVFGLAGLVGTALAGRLASRAPRPGALAGIAVVAVSLVGLGLTGAHPAGALLTVAVWGVAMQMTMPILTHQAVEAGGHIASVTVNGAANAGIAIGGLLGGGIVAVAPLTALPWVGAALAILITVLATTLLLSRTPAVQ